MPISALSQEIFPEAERPKAEKPFWYNDKPEAEQPPEPAEQISTFNELQAAKMRQEYALNRASQVLGTPRIKPAHGKLTPLQERAKAMRERQILSKAYTEADRREQREAHIDERLKNNPIDIVRDHGPGAFTPGERLLAAVEVKRREGPELVKYWMKKTDITGTHEASELYRLNKYMNTMAKGEELDEVQTMELAGFLAAAERSKELSKRGDWQATLLKMGDVAASIPAFAAQFVMTGGAFSVGRKTTERAAIAGLKKALGRTLQKKLAASATGRIAMASAVKGSGFAGGALAQTVALPQLTAANTARRMLSEIDLTPDEEGRLQVVVESGEDLGPALAKGFADSAIEIGSERAGAVVPFLGKAGFSKLPPGTQQAVKGLAIRSWLKLNPNKTVSDALSKVAGKAGWNGLLGEVFEERVGEVARSSIGIGDDFGITGKAVRGAFGSGEFASAAYDLMVEAGAFAVPGGARSAAGWGAQGIEAIGTRRTKTDLERWAEQDGKNLFRFEAVDQTGQEIADYIGGSTEEEARKRIEDLVFTVTKIKQEGKTPKWLESATRELGDAKTAIQTADEALKLYSDPKSAENLLRDNPDLAKALASSRGTPADFEEVGLPGLEGIDGAEEARTQFHVRLREALAGQEPEIDSLSQAPEAEAQTPAPVESPAIEPAPQPPIVRFRRQAAEIESKLPPVPEGHVRLWRGNRPNGDVGKNPSFTNDLPGIALPFKEGYGGPLTYVDVPQADLGKYEQKVGVALGAEFMLPQELASRSVVVDTAVEQPQGGIVLTDPATGEDVPINEPAAASPIDKLLKRAQAEDSMQAWADDAMPALDEKGITPQRFVDTFFAETWPQLNEAAQGNFLRSIENLAGMKIGDVLAVDKDGKRIIAETPIDLVQSIYGDFGSFEQMLDESYMRPAITLLARMGFTAQQMGKVEPQPSLPTTAVPAIEQSPQAEQPTYSPQNTYALEETVDERKAKAWEEGFKSIADKTTPYLRGNKLRQAWEDGRRARLKLTSKPAGNIADTELPKPSDSLSQPKTKGATDAQESQDESEEAEAPTEGTVLPDVEKREFSSTQVSIPSDIASKVISVGAKIDESDLADEGRETEPHVTVKFGLHTEDVGDIRKTLEGESPVRIRLGLTSVFKGEKYDVVKVDVHSGDLRRLNNKLSALPNTETHPTYIPHVTLAYVKPGMGEKYVGMRDLNESEFVIDEIVFSDKSRQHTTIRLNGSNPPKKKLGKNPVEPKPDNLTEGSDRPSQNLAKWVSERLGQEGPITSDEFFAKADEFFDGTRAQGKYGDSTAYDALELGLNSFYLNATDTTADATEAKREVDWLSGERVPRHKSRTGQKDVLQQFSTPPAYAYVAAWAANLRASDVVLEPSAGTGGIAVHAINSGAKVYGNEIDPARAELLRQFPVEDVFTEDAEFVGSILKDKMPAPTAVVMNPPFSRAGHKLGNKMVQGMDLKHIDSALQLLAPGGRLVAIVGAGLHGRGKGFGDWIADLPYAVRAEIEVARDVYKGHGTQFPTRLLVIDKVPRGDVKPVTGTAETLPALIEMLEGVRNDRPEPQQAQSVSQGAAKPSRSGREPELPVQPPTGEVGIRGTASSSADSPGSVQPPAAAQPRPRDGVESTSGTTAAGVAGPGVVAGSREPAGEGTSEQRPGERSSDDAGKLPREPQNASVGTPRSGRTVEPQEPEIDRLSHVKAKGKRRQLGESTYEEYQPGLKIKGAKKHPASIVESSAMAAVEAPEITYQPRIPAKVVEGYKTDKGVEVGISDIQLEAVAAVGQAHEHVFPNGQRRGFMIGDGTGVGKAREICGIILDNWIRGKRKAVWVSKNTSLFEPGRSEWERVGGSPSDMVQLAKVGSGMPIDYKQGILFSTYTSLSQRASDTAVSKGNTKSRLDQVIDWVGEDFDGVIIFDESHEMRSAMASKGTRGQKKASAKALAGVDLQNKLPKARIVYLSATSATEVENLAYATRLGLWGEGTAFPTRENFISNIARGGVAAMEKVAADMKALGMYLARSISFNDGTEKGTVTYERIEHTLTDDQVSAYDKMAEGWGRVLGNMGEALKLTGGAEDGMTVGNARGQFWGANQRFWNQVITAMQTPAILQSIERDLAEGRSAVVQLTNTNEASQNRALDNMDPEDDLDSIDVSPKYILMDYLERSFPTAQFEDYTDENGNERKRPVMDSKGNVVHNQQALAMKEQLLDELGSLQVANRSALDMVIDHFGLDQVAEVTGRQERIVQIEGKSKRQKRTPRARKADINDFMDGRKRVLIFSEAGGTGASYHADLTRSNTQKRHHYLLQAGWRADTAIQGLGRTHRSNQSEAPKYFLVHTNLKGQKRFLSTIARRLAQLGALTKGQRQAGEGGVFSASDNLESSEARQALRDLYNAILGGAIEGIGIEYLEDTLGLTIRDKQGNMKAELPPITQFMNRVLSLPVAQQNHIFEEFQNRLDRIVEAAIASGTLDQGMETVKAEKIEKISEQTVYRHETGAETKHVVVNLHRKTSPRNWDSASFDPKTMFFRSKKTGKLWAGRKTGTTQQNKKGDLGEQVHLFGPVESQYTTDRAMQASGNWERVKRDQAEVEWNEAFAAAPKVHVTEMNLLTGALLPVWDRLPSEHVQVRRLLTEDGEQILGRIIPADKVHATLSRLGVSLAAPTITPEKAIETVTRGGKLTLANGWTVKRTRVDGEWTIELVGPEFSYNEELERQGVFRRRVGGYQTKYFIPTGSEAPTVLAEVIKNRPITEVTTSDGDVMSLKQPTKQTLSTKPKNATEKANVAAADIIKTWERLFGVPIRVGGFSQRAAGIYKIMPEVVRTKESHYGNLAVAAHEVAHHVDKQTGICDSLSQPHRNELAGLDYEPKGRAFEGFAEFIRHYITEQDAKSLAPEFYKWFTETWMPENHKWATALNEAQKQARQYADQSVFQRIRSLIGTRPGDDLSWVERWTKNTKGAVGRFMSAIVDDLGSLKVAQDFAAEKGSEKRVYDTAMVNRFRAPNEAAQAFEKGVQSVLDGHEIGKTSLWGMARHLKNDAEYDEAVAYAYARHTLYEADHAPDYNTGMEVADAENWVAYIEEDADKHQRYEAWAKELAKFNNDLLWMMVDAGALSSVAAQKMIDRYGGDNYFPLHRVMDNGVGIFGSTGSKFVNLPPAVRRRSRTGSGRQVVDPVDATIRRAIAFYNRALQARVAHTLAESLDPRMGGVEGAGFLMDRLDPSTQVHEGTIEEILDTLVKEEVVDEDAATAMKIAAKLKRGDRLSNDSRKWFADRHGLVDTDTYQDWLDAANQEPDAMALISLWRPNFTPNAAKATFIIHDKNGDPIIYQADQELYRVATGIDELHFNAFWRFMASGARWFKTGAVGASTGFGTKNLIRDFVSYQGRAENQKGVAAITKPVEYLGKYIAYKSMKLAGMPVDNAYIELFEELGGKLYSPIGHDVRSRTRTRRKRMAKSLMSRFGVTLSHPGEAVENVVEAAQNVIAVTDAPPRLAEMEAAIRKAGYEAVGTKIRIVVEDGKQTDYTGQGTWYNLNTNRPVDHLPEEVRIQAAMAAAEATVNFKRIGSAGRYIESFLPFFNANVQSLYRQTKLVKGLRKLGDKGDAGTRARRYFIYLSAIAAASALYYLMRHDDDDYREGEPWLKEGNWTWGKEGRTYLRIPKPHEEAIVANVIELALDKLYHPDDAGNFLPGEASVDAGASSLLLRDLFGRVPQGGGLTRGAVEVFADYDFFRGRELTPDYLEHEPSELQSTPYTLESSKLIGRISGPTLGMSPIQVEHLLNSSSGGVYRRWLDTAEAVASGEAEAEHIPFVRGLAMNRHQARSISDFYDTLEQAKLDVKREEAYGEVSKESLAKKATLDDTAYLMTKIRSLDKKDVKGRRKFAYEQFIVGLAREALGREPLEFNPSPWEKDVDLPDEITAALHDFAISKAEASILSHGYPLKAAEGQTYEETVKAWKETRKQDEKWLRSNRSKPIVREAISEIIGSKSFNDLTSRKDKPSRQIGQDYLDHLDKYNRWMEKVEHAWAWKGEPL